MSHEDTQQQIALDQEFGKSLWLLSQTDNGLAKLQQEFNSELIDLTDSRSTNKPQNTITK